MNSERAFSLRRRRLLVAGVAGAAAFAAAGGYALLDAGTGSEEWIVAVIRRNLPGVQLDEASLAAFSRIASRHDGPILGSWRRRGAVVLARSVPVFADAVPRLEAALVEIERMIVSEFLLGSNFFQAANVLRERIMYVGRSPACGNPFAIFRS